MSRVLALIGAICLIAAAILARSLLVDDGGDDGGGDDGVGDLVVACIPELREACEAIDGVAELRVEDPADTIAAIAAGEDIGAWVTFDPWPTMASIIEARAEIAPTEAVAVDDLVLLARTSRSDGTGCPDPLSWACLVDGLQRSVAVPDPDDALGALVLGQAATDFFGGPFAANDFDLPQLADRFALLEVDGGAFDDMRVGLPEPAATGVLALELDDLGVRRGDFTESPSGAPATVAVVVAGPQNQRITRQSDFTAALRELGWQVGPDAATTGLPAAGVLVALQGAVG